MRREGLPGVPEFKGKIKPKESKVTRREFKNSPDNKFDRDNSLVGNAGNMEADIAAAKSKNTEVAADLKIAREEMENAAWEAKLAAARKKVEDEGQELLDRDLVEVA